MADNVALPATGVNALTDDCTTGHAQIVKLAISTDGSATLIPADATNGIYVNVKAVAADPFGANADAASATGSISAKLRFIAATGIPITNASGASAVNVQDGGNSLTVDAPVATPVFVRLSDGAAAITTLAVSLASVPSHAVTNAGTFAVQAALAAPAATTGGASTMNASSSDGATALTNAYQALKTSAGSLVGYYIYNPNATAAFVQFWNALTANVTVGTTTPLFMLTIPPASAANLWMPGGIAFGTALGWSATSTAGGNGAPTTALDAVAWYI